MNNNILIGHLGWDGCHFLCSCLTMSDEVYFNNLTLRGKIEYFFKGMSTISKVDGRPIWNDVFMFLDHLIKLMELIHYRHAWINDFHNDFEQFLVDSGLEQKTRISRLHVPIYYELERMLKKNISHPLMDMFKSKHFICLVNTRLFSSLRSIKVDHDLRVPNPNRWDKGFAPIPDIKWFDGPLTEFDEITNSITVSEFKLLPKEMQETIRSTNNRSLDDLFNLTELYKSDNNVLKSMITHEWDCNWFLDEQETIENIKILYSKMNLGNCNDKLISKMYKVWVDKMDYIKKWYIKILDQIKCHL